ncbi:MAG: GntR family transcriptional regulator [Phycisphaerales bacterium]
MDIGLLVNPQQEKPFVAQIQEQLRAKIRRRELPPGQKLPSIRKMSDRCGVSIGIVKQAVNTLTVEGYLRSHAGRGIYVADPLARRKNLALVLPAINTDLILRLIQGVKRALAQDSVQLVVQAADFDFAHEADLLLQLDRHSIAGALIYPPPLNSFIAPLRELQKRGIPFVLVDTAFDDLACWAVAADRRQMGRLAMQHLLDNGHRHIGVIDASSDAMTMRLMREGIDEVLRSRGLNWHAMPRAVTDAMDLRPGEPWENSRRVAIELLAAHPEITALIGMNHNLSIGGYMAARQLGRRVPDDLSVVVMGDNPTCHLTTPALTAVDQMDERVGITGTKQLLEVLNQPVLLDAPQMIWIPPELRIRDSVRSLR